MEKVKGLSKKTNRQKTLIYRQWHGHYQREMGVGGGKRGKREDKW